MGNRVCPECGSELNESGKCTNVMCDYEDGFSGETNVQASDEIAIEVRGEIVHLKDTDEDWERLGERLGLKVFKEYVDKWTYVLYDPKNFEVDNETFEHTCLRCISEENLELPINCKSCYGMFYEFEFKSKDALKNFDTSKVENMANMFKCCTFPSQFSMGDKFDTSSVEDMDSMFSRCTFHGDFLLGDKFDTSNTKTMRDMFCGCDLPSGFSLGDKFDTRNVEDVNGMFKGCRLPNQFSLGEKFDTSSIKDMDGMFRKCVLQDDFSFDSTFDISKVNQKKWMFFQCELPDGKTEEDFHFNSDEVVEWLKSRKQSEVRNTNIGKTSREMNVNNSQTNILDESAPKIRNDHETLNESLTDLFGEGYNESAKESVDTQASDEIVIEVRGETVRLRDTIEDWERVGNRFGLEVFKESHGKKNWVLYDPVNFKVAGGKLFGWYLECISDKDLKAPVNCSTCQFMFSGFKFKSKDALKDFDTSGVENMICMFQGCTFPECFSLGDKFATSSVESMYRMFADCTFPEQFLLGDNFVTNVVKDRKNMFEGCKLPEGKTWYDFNRDCNRIVEWLKSRNRNKMGDVAATDVNSSKTSWFKDTVDNHASSNYVNDSKDVVNDNTNIKSWKEQTDASMKTTSWRDTTNINTNAGQTNESKGTSSSSVVSEDVKDVYSMYTDVREGVKRGIVEAISRTERDPELYSAILFKIVDTVMERCVMADEDTSRPTDGHVHDIVKNIAQTCMYGEPKRELTVEEFNAKIDKTLKEMDDFIDHWFS